MFSLYVLNSCQFVCKCLNRSIQGVNLITRSRYYYKLHLPPILIWTVSYQLSKKVISVPSTKSHLSPEIFKTGSAVFLLTLKMTHASCCCTPSVRVLQCFNLEHHKTIRVLTSE